MWRKVYTMNIKIIKLEKHTEKTMNLLLLADPSKEAINDYIKRGECYVACYNDSIVGICILIDTRPLTKEIVNVSVEENYQRKGIGKSLILDAIDRSRKSNVKVLEIGTGNSSLHQLGLYQKCGFRICSIDKDFFKLHYNEKIIENGIECRDMIRLSLEL